MAPPVSFDEAYDRYTPELLRRARRWAKRDRGLAEDLVADTWLAILELWDQYDAERASVRTWLHTTLRWRCVRAWNEQPYMRGCPLEGRLVPESDLEPSTGLRHGVLRHLAVVDPHDEREEDPDPWARERVWLREAIAALPARQREVVEAELTGGLQAELARAIGITHETFRANLYRAKRRLREMAPSGMGRAA